MRITFGMQTDETLLNLNDQQEQITKFSQQISSGTQLSSASDDPYGWSQAMNVNQTIREYNSFVDGVNFATGWGQATESGLNQLSDLLSEAKQLGITAGSAKGSDNSAGLVTQLNGILSQALSIANTQYGGQYIFAGSATDTEPYSIDNSTGQVTYSGNTDPINVKTSTNTTSAGTTTVNLTGEEVFGSAGGSGNVLNAIWSLDQAVQSGNSTNISNAVSTIGDAFDQVNTQLAAIGGKLSTLSDQKTALNTTLTNEQGTLSNLQDANLASAATKLSQAQTAYQAALQVTSLLDNLNLSSILSGSSVA